MDSTQMTYTLQKVPVDVEGKDALWDGTEGAFEPHARRCAFSAEAIPSRGAIPTARRRAGLERARAHGRTRGERNAVTRLAWASCPPERLCRLAGDLGARDADVKQIEVRHLRQLRPAHRTAMPP